MSARTRRRARWLALAGALAITTGCASTGRDTGRRAGSWATVSFPAADGGVVFADEYGKGAHAILLAHGGRFTKESWREQAMELAGDGFRVVAIDFRGRGDSRAPAWGSDDACEQDVLGAITYAKASGAERVSVVGASVGGWAAAEASTSLAPGEIDALVLIAHSPIDHPEEMTGRKLFILARNDPNADGSLRLEAIREQYDKAPDPKELVLLSGAAHAQFIFETGEGDRLMREVLAHLAGR